MLGKQAAQLCRAGLSLPCARGCGAIVMPGPPALMFVTVGLGVRLTPSLDVSWVPAIMPKACLRHDGHDESAESVARPPNVIPAQAGT